MIYLKNIKTLQEKINTLSLNDSQHNREIVNNNENSCFLHKLKDSFNISPPPPLIKDSKLYIGRTDLWISTDSTNGTHLHSDVPSSCQLFNIQLVISGFKIFYFINTSSDIKKEMLFDDIGILHQAIDSFLSSKQTSLKEFEDKYGIKLCIIGPGESIVFQKHIPHGSFNWGPITISFEQTCFRKEKIFQRYCVDISSDNDVEMLENKYKTLLEEYSQYCSNDSSSDDRRNEIELECWRISGSLVGYLKNTKIEKNNERVWKLLKKIESNFNFFNSIIDELSKESENSQIIAVVDNVKRESNPTSESNETLTKSRSNAKRKLDTFIEGTVKPIKMDKD